MTFNPNTRRINQRHDVEIPVTIDFNGNLKDSTITNISVGGLYIDGPHKYLNKEIINLTFNLPTLKKPFSVDTVVRWIEREDGDVIGIGVQFVGIKAIEVWALTKYFSSLDSQII
jgi:Tfp pilus assembly protein PilZ